MTAKAHLHNRDLTAPIKLNEKSVPGAILIRRPNAVLWKFNGCLTSHHFENETKPAYARDHFVNYLERMVPNLSTRLVDLERRFRRDAKIDRDAGEKDVPQIPDGIEQPQLFEAMHKYFAYRTQIGKNHPFSPVSIMLHRVCRDGFENDELKMPVFSDASKAVAIWRSTEYFIKNYTLAHTEPTIQELHLMHTPDGGIRKSFNSCLQVAKHKMLQSAYYKSASNLLRDKPDNLLFITDNPLEANAAKEAGWIVAVMRRQGEKVYDISQLQDIPVIDDINKLEFEYDPKRPPDCC